MRNFIVLFLLLFTIKAFSIELVHKQWYAGYFINLESDTIIGFVMHRNSPSISISSFKYPDGERKALKANEIRAYGYSGKTFESCRIVMQYQFLERIINGRIEIYEQKNNHYIRKGNRDVVKINKALTKSILLDYIEDNKQQYESVKKLDHVTAMSIIPIVSDYNKWAKINYNDNSENNPFIAETRNDIVKPIKSELSNEQDSGYKATNKLLKQQLFTVRFNLLGTGLGFETRITNNSSLYIEAGTGITFFASTNSESSLKLYPRASLQARIYTNLKKRYQSGKSTKGWTGNYISPFLVLSSTPDEEQMQASVFYGLNYGFQRQKGNTFYWGFDIGGGIRTILSNKLTTPDYLLKINLGFAI